MNEYLIVLLMILIAVFFDERSRKIPNKLIIAGAISGLVISCYMRGLEGLFTSLIGVFVPIAILFIFYVLKMIGAGDIKLIAAVGAFTGAIFAVKLLIFSILSGGIIALIIVLVRKNALERIKYIWNYFVSIFILRKISIYQSYVTGNDGLFKFSYAILCGYILAYYIRIF